MKIPFETFPRRVACAVALSARLFTLLTAVAQFLDRENEDDLFSRILLEFDPDVEANIFNWYQSSDTPVLLRGTRHDRVRGQEHREAPCQSVARPVAAVSTGCH